MSDDQKRSSEQQTPDTAVALQYAGFETPRVTAKGQGELAQQIKALAEEHDVPLHEDPALLQLLAHIDVGEEIPRNLYVAVAEVIAFIYWLEGKTPSDHRSASTDRE